MKVPDKLLLAAMGIAVAAAAITIVLAWEVPDANAQEAKTPVAGQASLTVTVASLQPATFPIRVSANGNIMAWQEASIGTEANGLRLTDVKVNVGDTVRRGQSLAIFAADTVEAELAQTRAAVAEADVALAEGCDAEKVVSGEGDLVFNAVYELLPTFEIQDWTGIEIERPVVTVSDDEVKERLLVKKIERACFFPVFI